MCFYLFLTVLCGLRDLSSPPRNRTYTLGSEITAFWPLLCAQMLSHVWLCVTPWTVAHQAPLSMGCSRQESWSGLLCPPPGDLPDPGIKHISPWYRALSHEFFTTCSTWKAQDHQGVPEFLFYWEYKGIFFFLRNNQNILGDLANYCMTEFLSSYFRDSISVCINNCVTGLSGPCHIPMSCLNKSLIVRILAGKVLRERSCHLLHGDCKFRTSVFQKSMSVARRILSLQ